MNSKQRRTDKRMWKYHVDVSPVLDPSEIWFWCRSTFGFRVSDGWRSKYKVVDGRWEFDSEEKAAMFALRWVK